MYRVGIIAWLQESNTFLTRKTTLADFQNDVLLTGDAVRQRFADAPHEVGGFFGGLTTAGLTAVPIFAGRAYPFGTIVAEAFEELLQQMLTALKQAGQLDGVLVAPHGATVSEKYPDADGHWLQAVRDVVGPRVPIMGTLDPHANLSPAMVAATDALTAYRTNPHTDQRARGLEAADLMVRTLRGEIRPTQAAGFPPTIINIERQCTDEPPLRELVAQFELARQKPGVLSTSLLLGFPYADVAEMGSATIAVTDNNPQLAQEQATDLAQKMWALRRELAGDLISVADAVRRVPNSSQPVCLLDMGDNVGGGSPGDGTLLAWELQRQKVCPSFVCLYDPAAVVAAEQAGVGQRLTLTMGGKTDNLHGPPFVAEVTVRQLTDGVFQETEARHGGFTQFDQGRTAIVETAEGLTIMLTSRRVPPFSLRQLTAFGVEPTKYQALVAKGVNAPLAAYRPVCPTMIRVNTPGVTTADMSQLTFHHRRKPMFPFEQEMKWEGVIAD